MSNCCGGKQPKKIKEWGPSKENTDIKNKITSFFKKILKQA